MEDGNEWRQYKYHAEITIRGHSDKDARGMLTSELELMCNDVLCWDIIGEGVRDKDV